MRLCDWRSWVLWEVVEGLVGCWGDMGVVCVVYGFVFVIMIVVLCDGFWLF